MSTPHLDLLRDLDWLQQAIAENTIEHGVDRIITPEIFSERLRHYLGVAKLEVEAIGPETDADNSNYKAQATIFGARGEEANVCVAFGTNTKRQKMWALSQTCRITLAQGVIFRDAMTGANMEQIAKAMGLHHPDPFDRQKVEYFEAKMWKWIKQNYGKARLAALPPEMRWDGIVVAGFGPKLPEAGLTSRYWWENGRIQFQDVPSEHYGIRVSLIPRWWQ
jgi:hypothetical protein